MNKAVKLLFVLSLVLLLGAGTCYSAESYKFATTDMTWAEFYAGEVEKSSADLYADGLDAVSSPTARIANSFSQLTSESNDIGGRSITGVKAVQVRMSQEVYNLLSKDKRYTFSDDVLPSTSPLMLTAHSEKWLLSTTFSRARQYRSPLRELGAIMFCQSAVST